MQILQHPKEEYSNFISETQSYISRYQVTQRTVMRDAKGRENNYVVTAKMELQQCGK